MNIDIEKIVTTYYEKGRRLGEIEETQPLSYFIDKVKTIINDNLYILTEKDFHEDVDMGYEDYITKDEIGTWVWHDGECHVGKRMLEVWASSSYNELTNEYVTSENDFEMYVVESSLLEVINIRNSLLPPAVG